MKMNNTILFWHIFLGWITFTVVLGLSPILVDRLSLLYPMSEPIQQLLQGVMVTGVSFPTLLLLCKKVIQTPIHQLGLISPKYGWPFFLLGIGGFSFFLIFSLWLSQLLGWSHIHSLHFSVPLLLSMLVNIPAAFLYEAFPEELVFRGYIFHNLRQSFQRWLAVLLQVVFFVCSPLSLAFVLPLFGITGWLDFNLDYLITLFIFGITLQLCKIVTGNLWMNIGFHLTFLMNARFLVSDQTTSFIQVDFIHKTESTILIFLGPCLFMIAVLLVLQNVKKRKGI